jgi:uroporphyrinogen decarboxylase
MNDSREVIAALLRKQIPERMGVNEHFWPFIRENAWTAQGMPDKVSFEDYFDLDLASAHWYSPPGPRPDLVATIEENKEWKMVRGAWGDVTKTWVAKAGTPEHVGFAVDAETWRREFREAFLAMDPLTGVDLATIKADRDRLRAQGRFVTFSFMFVFEWARKVMGDVTMLESLLLEAEFIHDFNRVFTDKFLQFYQRAFAEIGLPDGIHFYEDLGYTQSAFCSPACHRELVHPFHCELLRFFKDHGLPVIMHTCGDFRPHLPAIVESGVDCIQAMEAKTGMNVVELARDWKDKLCFMGNLDVRAFESNDRQRLEAEVLGKIRGLRELRAPYIVMSDHSIPPTVNLDTFRWYLDLVRRHYRY